MILNCVLLLSSIWSISHKISIYVQHTKTFMINMKKISYLHSTGILSSELKRKILIFLIFCEWSWSEVKALSLSRRHQQDGCSPGLSDGPGLVSRAQDMQNVQNFQCNLAAEISPAADIPSQTKYSGKNNSVCLVSKRVVHHGYLIQEHLHNLHTKNVFQVSLTLPWDRTYHRVVRIPSSEKLPAAPAHTPKFSGQSAVSVVMPE